MKVISEILMKHKKKILILFIIAVIFSAFISQLVSVNYNMMDYLPEEAKSTESLEVMNQEFDTAIPNLRVVVKNVSITEALEYKEKISKVEGVEEIKWIDDTFSTYIPLETLDEEILKDYYKDNNAIFSVVLNEDTQVKAIEEIRNIIGDDNLMAGDSYNNVSAENATSEEITRIVLFIIPLILLVLFLTTTSWFEPILFLGTIGIAIILNVGTNAFLGEISFVTNAAGSILQLAVSMDYSIFLLHRFAEEREKESNVENAMKNALVKSYKSILSSGLTTVVGFAALILMKFKIGPDMGIVMAKSIALSLICVLFLLPIISVYCYKLIDKTKHKKLMPNFEGFSKLVIKVGIFAVVLFVVIIVPSNLASKKIEFSYGASEIFKDKTKGVAYEQAQIEDLFGKSNEIVLMVPKGDFAKEEKLINEINELPEVTNVVSYVTSVGSEIPMEYVPQDTLKELISENYSRIIINIDRPVQGDETFKSVEKLREISEKYYGDKYQMCGESVNTYDMKETVIKDNVVVNAVAIIAIFLILLFNFKSLSLPFILLLVIELSIWVNLSFPYFASKNLNYISYLIISSIQLGATIDYAILYTDRYIENRREMLKIDAIKHTTKDTILSILTSAGILTIAGFFLGNLSSNQVISELGILVGRGAIISELLVFFVLPSLLKIFDKLINKTTKDVEFKN